MVKRMSKKFLGRMQEEKLWGAKIFMKEKQLEKRKRFHGEKEKNLNQFSMTRQTGGDGREREKAIVDLFKNIFLGNTNECKSFSIADEGTD